MNFAISSYYIVRKHCRVSHNTRTTPSKINIMLKLFQTSSTGTIWKYTGSPRWSSCFLRRQITFFFSSRIRLKPFILKYTLHFSFSQNLRNHKRTPYSPSADRWQDVSHQSSHIFPVLSNIHSVHTAHLTSHSFHLIISWISLRFTHKIPGYPGEFPFVLKNPKQLNICFFCSSFSLSPYSCGNLLPFQHQFYLTVTTIQ